MIVKKLSNFAPFFVVSLQRIDNWATLTEREKEVTWRRIRKRNAERREALKAKQKEQE